MLFEEMNKMSKVIIEKCNENSIENSLDKLLKKLGGLNRYVSKGDKVFIKPNMLLDEKPETGRTTHPGLVLALSKRLYELGAVVTVGERGGNIENVFKDYGYQDIYKYAKVVNLDNEEFILVDPQAGNYVINFPLPIAKVVDEADFVINMPGLRTHVLTNISNALKNVMGFLPRNITRLVHLAGLDEAIVDLNRTIKVDLIITDAIYSLQGSFPANGGQPLKTDFIMASTDPVALDTIAAKIIGYQAEDINSVVLAAKAGLGEMDINKIKIDGELKKYDFDLPKPANYVDEYKASLGIYSDNACDRCKRALGNGIFAFYQENNVDDPELLKKINLIAGKSYPGELGEGFNIIYGNCAKTYFGKGVFEPGCPPLTSAVKKRMKELYEELKESQ